MRVVVADRLDSVHYQPVKPTPPDVVPDVDATAVGPAAGIRGEEVGAPGADDGELRGSVTRGAVEGKRVPRRSAHGDEPILPCLLRQRGGETDALGGGQARLRTRALRFGLG